VSSALLAGDLSGVRAALGLPHCQATGWGSGGRVVARPAHERRHGWRDSVDAAVAVLWPWPGLVCGCALNRGGG
jgi:hypothetical protein